MKVLHVSSSDFGGAGIAAMRLHKAMVECGINSSFMSLDNQINDGINYFRYNVKIDEIIVKPECPPLSIKNYLKERFFKTFSKQNEYYFQNKGLDKSKFEIKYNSSDFEVLSTPFSEYDITESGAYKEADIIHLHWISGYVDYPSFFEKNKKPIVWTIHDESPFRGAFHYKADEIRNQSKYHLINKTYEQIKFNSIRKANSLTIVSPSLWLAEEAKTRPVFNKRRIISISNLVDLTVFKPLNKSFSKDFWGIPNNATVFTFACQSIDNYRKGLDLLIPIIEKNELKDVYYLIVGKKNNSIENDNLIYTGHIESDRLMALAYSTADYFILPSREDNLPNTMLESIACGTPVITFPIGDGKKIISDSGCGILTEEVSTASLEKTMKVAIIQKGRFSVDHLSSYAELHFGFKDQVRKYQTEYLRLL
jgi:glycosyltransferase involved in cell wall biosynthesis